MPKTRKDKAPAAAAASSGAGAGNKKKQPAAPSQEELPPKKRQRGGAAAAAEKPDNSAAAASPAKPSAQGAKGPLPTVSIVVLYRDENSSSETKVTLSIDVLATVADLKRLIMVQTLGSLTPERMKLYTTDRFGNNTELDERGGNGGGLVVAYKGIDRDGKENKLTLEMLGNAEAGQRFVQNRTTLVPIMPKEFYQGLGLPPPPPPAPSGQAVANELAANAAANAQFRKAIKNRPKTPRKTRGGASGGAGAGAGEGEARSVPMYSPWGEDETRVIIDYLQSKGMHNGCWASISKELGTDPTEGKPVRTGVQVKDRWRNLCLAADRTDTKKMRHPVAEDILVSVRSIRTLANGKTPRQVGKLDDGTPKESKGKGKASASTAAPPAAPPAPPPS